MEKNTESLAKKHPIEYRTYSSMKTRCFNKKSPAYKDYGGRGITIDDRWLGANGFAIFLNDMGERPSNGLSVDRINVNGDYSATNCRWATQKEQANNRRSNKCLTYNGETHTISEWADITGLGVTTIHARLKRYGWPIERILTTPPNNDKKLRIMAREHGIDRLVVWKRLRRGWSLEDALTKPIGYHQCRKIVEYKGEKKPLTDWCKELGKDYDTVVKRLKYGWTPEEAFTLEKDQYTPRSRRRKQN